jgi:hypothetical protein
VEVEATERYLSVLEENPLPPIAILNLMKNWEVSEKAIEVQYWT